MVTSLICLCTAGKYCLGDGLAEPTGDCAAGWYCQRGAFDPRPSYWMNITEDPLCPIYSLNETGGVCWPGEHLHQSKLDTA